MMKGKDITLIYYDKIACFADSVDNHPRKRLDWRFLYGVFRILSCT